MFGSKKIKINLQSEIKLNNEVIVLDSFIQIFSIRGTYFSQFLIIPKTKYSVSNQARYYSSLVSFCTNIDAIVDTSFNSIYTRPTLQHSKRPKRGTWSRHQNWLHALKILWASWIAKNSHSTWVNSFVVQMHTNWPTVTDHFLHLCVKNQIHIRGFFFAHM